MTSPADFLAAAMISIASGIVVAASELELPRTLVGWLGVLGTLLGALALYRAGSVRAWKETAAGRGERIEDLERELAEMRVELSIPERIEGIISLMASTADRQDRNASERLELALSRMEERWDKHNAAAEVRTMRLERGHEAIELRLHELLAAT